MYIPDGEHPFVATSAMMIVLAKVAGVNRVVAARHRRRTVPSHPPNCTAMDRTGVGKVYCIDGVQAIGSMVYGTESVPTVDLVTGPGNVFTTEAKRQMFGMGESTSSPGRPRC